MKSKDMPKTPHFAVMEFETKNSYVDDWNYTYDDVTYHHFETKEDMEMFLASRWIGGVKKDYRVVEVRPMEVTYSATATLK
ncbi:hypothetical protein PHIN3_59 [Sinorhizobium phage phiN3]|uniref:Uncharacterized protein n=1 Tax=Sinorhizobium phage phiN3 TaxID=1647405 RepID=A0A0F6WCQ3_9CAUD|nr:hypothetical protein AVT40_gp059 [Sinorhizobium phage phiN3]AKF13324.1 hypothetical protein PHIN3_59 [Sinorhizobium phage phiN3]